MLLLRTELLSLGTAVLSLAQVAPMSTVPPSRVALYYPGPPCELSHIDRKFSQFQVNLDAEMVLGVGRLTSGESGAARLVNESGREIELRSNASRADWLLSYPLTGEGVGVWGRPVLGPGCVTAGEAIYVESLFPVALFSSGIGPRLDLMRRADAAPLQQGVRDYRLALGGPNPAPGVDEVPSGRRWGAASTLEEALFAPEAARTVEPWRALLLGPEEQDLASNSIDIILSGRDGSTGVFGHIAVGSGGRVYNIYPKGSERGAPDVVPLWDYLFNALRGQALNRPTWILRLEGLPDEIVADFDRIMRRQVDDIQEGRSAYHPTANNCTIASLVGLNRLGFEVSKARYFTRRFPRPAFAHILESLRAFWPQAICRWSASS